MPFSALRFSPFSSKKYVTLRVKPNEITGMYLEPMAIERHRFMWSTKLQQLKTFVNLIYCSTLYELQKCLNSNSFEFEANKGVCMPRRARSYTLLFTIAK